MNTVLAFDLGTGGVKTSLFDEAGRSLASSFAGYETFYPGPGRHEQRPEDWWSGVVRSTREVLEKTEAGEVAAMAVSGHSLGAVPLDADGRLLVDSVPIWSDSRAGRQAEAFFRLVREPEWYLTTGNGFPPALYSLFKIMWYRGEAPEVYERAAVFLGTKDYVNYKLTGVCCTDRSYASGSGAYSLQKGVYVDEYLAASGVAREKLPEIADSAQVIGALLPEAAKILGLRPGIPVCAGGVDNACMALGAGCLADGEAYTSLGTSAWIAVSGREPILSLTKRPYVFAHCVPGQNVSATCIFAAGSCYRWARETLCRDLVQAEQAGGEDSYRAMDRLARTSPAGANGLLFYPALAGGSSLDASAFARGGFSGLELRHTRADLLRAILEGVCLNLRLAMDVLARQTPLREEMLLVGGGGKSAFWRQIFADVYEKIILQTAIGQDAGSLGAAAIAAVGVGLWADYGAVRGAHVQKTKIEPNPEAEHVYRATLPAFARAAEVQAGLGRLLREMETK